MNRTDFRQIADEVQRTADTLGLERQHAERNVRDRRTMADRLARDRAKRAAECLRAIYAGSQA